MRLLKRGPDGEVSVTEDLSDAGIPPYIILSHTWSVDDRDEVTLEDLKKGQGMNKPGWAKVQFCASRAKEDGVEHFWIDTCSIDKANLTELSEAINSMFRWYKNAHKCYVYLSDVSAGNDNKDNPAQQSWEADFRTSRWFKRGWTLQELLAPATVEFFSRQEKHLGSKNTLGQLIQEITTIPIAALRGKPLSEFPVEERERWRIGRSTKRKEDEAYCLQGIFNVFMPPIYGEGENAMKRLNAEISKLSQISVTSDTHVHWFVTRPRNPLFTGRDDILQTLDRIIANAVQYPQSEKQCRIVISGIGGEGKSEICLQLANRHRQRFWGVFWIDASSTSLAERSFLDIAHRLSLPARSWEDAQLSIANLKNQWLLVLDNADDPNVDYQQFFPESPLGVVILTSRNDDCHQYATTPVRLEGLAENEAQELLLKAAKIPQDKADSFQKDAQVVARLLQSHVLALIQAGAYISHAHCTLASYPQVYKRQRQQLLAFRPKQAQSRYGDVFTTFEASADNLKTLGTETAQDALQLLSLLAICGPNQIPILLLFEIGWRGSRVIPADMNDNADDEYVLRLTPWHTAHLPSLVDTTSDYWNCHRLVEAVQLLKEFSLVSFDSQTSNLSVSMHPLVHAWARDRQDKDKLHQSWLQMGSLLVFWQYDILRFEKHQRQLQAHIEEIVGWNVSTIFADEPPVMVARILINCGQMLNIMRSDTKLFSLLERLFDYLQLDRQIIEHQWLGIYILKGKNLVNCAKPKEAVTIMENIVKVQEERLPKDHPARLTSQLELAGAYRANRQAKQSVALLESVVKIVEKSPVDEDHLYRLTSQQELARAYQADGQIKESVALLESIVKSKKQSLAENHPAQHLSQYVLAQAYGLDGQIKEAVVLLENVVKIQEQSLVEDHPSRLIYQHELARAYQGDGQIKEAVALLEHVVKIQELSLAEDHPDLLVTQYDLARAYQGDGQIKKAVALLEHVVKIREQSLAEDHPDLLVTQYKLAQAYQGDGQNKKAVELLERVVKIKEQSPVKKDYPSLHISQRELAHAYIENGQTKESVELLERVVKIKEQSPVKKDYPSPLMSQRELARAYQINRQGKESVELLESVVKIMEQSSVKEDHPSRLEPQQELAEAYMRNAQTKQAVALLENVVKMREQSLAEDHPSRLKSQYSLGVAYWQIKDYHRGFEIMKHVVAVQAKVLDANHPDRLNSELLLELLEEDLGTTLDAPIDDVALDLQASPQDASRHLTRAQRHQEGNDNREWSETFVSLIGDITANRLPLAGESRAALKARSRKFFSKLSIRQPKP